ncbi:tRNA uracil 4-sulfurtransferase ThiI [Leadbettera azotonutricia]|uniref:Probable tRNA sulfurtransferase n=1 Tax=Leadbettera azotonutricia (strain ATCC BAA-888 / DSM 13862 / ZAS-9) TaxID=545695 RepID=F5YCB1_LEAAZ|nr:thiamine biosynthesis/tRNA modification protein ThiI [Leadbettera azotonutricia ZAS-9]
MSKTLYLLKPGELTLKGGNRQSFEAVLRRNLAALLKGTGAQVSTTNGRFFVRCPEGSELQAEDALNHLVGISGWAKTRICEKEKPSVLAACVEEGRLLVSKGIKTFKVEARRTDKSFPLNSYEIECQAGDAICEAFPNLKVDVHEPEGIVSVEIREKAFIYGIANQGLRGLPVGTAGRGLLLLSGGIDSPVAGFMMACRGMSLEAVYFHAYPYTSNEARQKTVKLAEIVGRYSLGMRLFVINFTPLQMRIKERSPEEWRTVLLRMAMMDCAEKLAIRRGNKCLVSGESLSQVASQTIENITCTQSRVTLPVLRPLIGTNKEQIIGMAKKLGTYETSILPYEDCCVLFSPPHPILRGDPEEAWKLYEALECGDLIEEALRAKELERCGYPAKP